MVFLRGSDEGDTTYQSMLENSVIVGVPQIARSNGWVRIWKLFIFTMCWLGFLYQIFQFALIFWTYPVILNIEVTYPKMVQLPAITLCLTNWINQVKYCDLYKEDCYEDEKGNFMIKEAKYQYLKKWAPRELFYKVGNPIDRVFIYQMAAWNQGDFIPKGFFKLPVVSEEGERAECFLFNSQMKEPTFNQSQIPAQPSEIYSVYRNSAQAGFLFNITELRDPDRAINFVSIHSPYSLSNAVIEGKVMNRGQIYIIGFKTTRLRLLPAPYKTDCFDYLEAWKVERKGPLSKLACVNECIFRLTMGRCGCIPAQVLHLTDARFCAPEDDDCLDLLDIEDCNTKCKPDCQDVIYDYSLRFRYAEYTMDLLTEWVDMQTSKAPNYDLDFFSYKKEAYSVGALAMDRTEELAYTYNPKYETIEMFSYIGGYIGVWLGISLAGLADIFKMAGNIIQRGSGRNAAQKTRQNAL